MFVVVVFLEAKREYKFEVQRALVRYAHTCLDREPGCRRFDVALDPVDAASFLLYEVYTDETAHRAHRELPHYAEFRLLVEPWIATRRVLTYNLLETANA